MNGGVWGKNFIRGLALEMNIFVYIFEVTKPQEEAHQATQVLGVFKKLSKDLVP